MDDRDSCRLTNQSRGAYKVPWLTTVSRPGGKHITYDTRGFRTCRLRYRFVAYPVRLTFVEFFEITETLC